MKVQQEESFVQMMTLKGKNEWDLVQMVFIGQTDLKILKKDFLLAYEEVLTKCKRGNINSCHIKFLIVPDIVSKSNELLEMCYSLCDTFVSKTYLGRRLPLIKTVTVNFTYDKDEMIIEKNYHQNCPENIMNKPWWKF